MTTVIYIDEFVVWAQQPKKCKCGNEIHPAYENEGCCEDCYADDQPCNSGHIVALRVGPLAGFRAGSDMTVLRAAEAAA